MNERMKTNFENISKIYILFTAPHIIFTFARLYQNHWNRPFFYSHDYKEDKERTRFPRLLNRSLLQLSYADTHPMFTSDSFPNFFRVVPSENAFNAPRVALLLHFNWTRVGTIYQNEPRYALVSIWNFIEI